MKFVQYFFILFFNFSTISNAKSQTYKVEQNRISPNFPECVGNFPKEHYNFHGIEISTYYTIRDSVIFFDSCKKLNYIIVLSPITQEYSKDTLPCDNEKGKRLLVSLKFKNNSCYIDFINENIIPNIFEFQTDPYLKIATCKKGFYLELFTGSRVKCTYDYFFFSKNERFYLNSMKYECYVIDLSANENKVIKFKRIAKRELNNIDIHDYLYESKL